MEGSKKSSEVVSEADVEWAYGVLSTIKEAMDKASGDLQACNQLMRELLDELPDILEAFIILVDEEHKQMVAGVVHSWVKMISSMKRT